MKAKLNKVLILGASGMLGRTVLKYLRETHPNHVYGTSRSKEKGLIYFEAAEKSNLRKVFKKSKFNYVVNCIGVLKNTGNRKDFKKINSLFPQFLDEMSRTYNFRLIHISSDGVFHNLSGTVTEKSRKFSNDTYGKSKLEGEVKNGLNIRTSIVGFDPKAHSGVLEYAIQANGKLVGFINQQWSGATVLQLANFLSRLIYEEKYNSLISKTNTIHFAPLGPTTKYDLLKTFSTIVGKKKIRKGRGEKITRALTSNYIDEIEINIYTNDLKKALKDLIEFDKEYVKKFKEN